MYVLSLFITLVILIPAVMILGILPEINEIAVGGSPTASYLNATSWTLYSNVYAAFGLEPLILISSLLVIFLLVGMFWAAGRMEASE